MPCDGNVAEPILTDLASDALGKPSLTSRPLFTKQGVTRPVIKMSNMSILTVDSLLKVSTDKKRKRRGDHSGSKPARTIEDPGLGGNSDERDTQHGALQMEEEGEDRASTETKTERETEKEKSDVQMTNLSSGESGRGFDTNISKVQNYLR